MGFLHSPLWPRLLKVGRPFFTSELRRRASLALALLVGLLLVVNGLNVVNSYTGANVMTALAERQVGRFYVFAAALAGVFAASTILEVLARYVEQRLGLLWRDWLTRRFLDRYLAGRAYRRLVEQAHIDNPDQRISEDVRTFTATSLSFLILLFNAILTFLAFASVLWLITPWLFLAAVVYAAAGSFGTILLGRRLVGLNNLQLRKEADFRYALGRVREHSRRVAQLESEGDEKARLGGKLAALVYNFRAIVVVSRNLGFFTTWYDYMPQIIPVLLAAPLYLRSGAPLGTVTQAAMAFSQLLGAFSLIVRQFQELSAYAAVGDRLGSMWEATEPGAAPSPTPETPPVPAAPPPPGPAVEIVEGGRKVAFEGVTLWTPCDHRVLIRDLNLDVLEGKRLAVTGPCGSGKTALLLAVAGLWGAGQGRIGRPGSRDVLFVPQQPYTPSGRLRDALLYGLARPGVSDERLWDVVRKVELETAVRREGGLDAEGDWVEVLSWGEQRALAFARLLLARPRFAFLDDAASPLETPHAERLYQALAQSSITYISVGCGLNLLPFHDLRLELLGDGKWRVGPAPEAAALSRESAMTGAGVIQ